MNWKLLPGLVALILIAGLILWKQDTNDAMDFCISIIEKAEAAKQKSGSYPQNLVELVSASDPLPDLIRESTDKYHRIYEIIDGYPACSFIVTGGLFPRLYTYSGKTKAWEIRD